MKEYRKLLATYIIHVLWMQKDNCLNMFYQVPVGRNWNIGIKVLIGGTDKRFSEML